MNRSMLVVLLSGLSGPLRAQTPSLAVQAEEPGLPQVDATLSPDGHFTLVLRADVAWSQAEVVVGDAPSVMLGPSDAGHPVHVEGVTDSRGSLDVSLLAVDAGSRGIQWIFSVDPVEVPAAAPPLTGRPEPRRGWFGRLGKGR